MIKDERPILIIDRFGDDFNGFNIAGMASILIPEQSNYFIDSVINSNSFEDTINKMKKYVNVVFVERA